MVERLSSLHFGPVKSVSLAKFVGDTSTPESAQCPYLEGRLKEVRLLSVLGENYLQMEGVNDNHCSVILTSHLKAVSEEMVVLCKDAGTSDYRLYDAEYHLTKLPPTFLLLFCVMQ